MGESMKGAARIAIAAIAVAGVLAPPILAQTRTDRLPAPTGDPTPLSVEQKRAMVTGIVRDSPLATRIAASPDPDVRRHFATARALQEQATTLLAAGRIVAADALLNEAMWQIGRARALAPDPAAALIEERERFRQLQDSIFALQRSYEINLARERARGAGEPTAGRELDKARALIAEADVLGAADRYADGSRVLDRALALLLADFNVVLGGQALIYSRAFPQPQDEYPFELERNRSYESLVPLAVTEYRPGKDALALIDRYVQENRSLREQAQKQAAARNLKAAVQSLQDGTEALQRALQAAGLVVPQTTGQQ
jgi:hypothetical protein